MAAAADAHAPATFEFLVQRQADGMSIDDSTIEWDEARAPFRRVATITIPPQDFQSPAQMTLAEQISYTPWHSLPAHAPLGGVNRVRRRRLRKQFAAAARTERRAATGADLDRSRSRSAAGAGIRTRKDAV